MKLKKNMKGELNKGIIIGILISFLFFYIYSSYFSSSGSSSSISGSISSSSSSISCPYIKFNGGSPLSTHVGSCWCGIDSYCLCTPSLAIDAIIEISSNHYNNDIYIVLVQRKDSNDLIHAIPGGFVNVDETVENATKREVKEETNLNIIKLNQFRVYSDPTRDKRRHTVSVVFRCIVDNTKQMKNGDDAKGVVVVSLKDSLYTLKFAFDHRVILEDYVRFYHPTLAPHILKNNFLL